MTSSASPRLRHLGFFTRDMENMRRFYTEVMGMTVTDDGSYGEPLREIAFLSSDPGEHHELVLAEAMPETEGVGSAQQISFLADSLEELRAMHKRTTSAGHKSCTRPATAMRSRSISATPTAIGSKFIPTRALATRGIFLTRYPPFAGASRRQIWACQRHRMSDVATKPNTP